MANRRTQIEIVVLNLADLQAANTALSRHNTLIQKLTASYQGLNGVTGQLGSGASTLNQTFNTFNTTTNNTTNNITNLRSSLTNANSASLGLLGSMLRYRAVSLVFEGITKSVTETVQRMAELEKQSARVQRVSPSGSTPYIRSVIGEETSRTGADIKDVAEAYYQLQTRISDTAISAKVLQTAMNLVVGTEADARDVTRGMIQIVSQFPDAFGKATSEAEKYRRAGELIASTFKMSAAETTELLNSLKYLGPIAEATHTPLEQVFGVITALSSEGVRGRMAGTEAGGFLTNLLKNYKENLSGGPGIEKDGFVYHFRIVRDKNGEVDLLNTLKNIKVAVDSLPIEKQTEFNMAVGGSAQALRFLGGDTSHFFDLADRSIQKARDDIRGLTHDSEALRKDMTTTSVEFSRVWNSVFGILGNLVDASPLRSWLHGVNDDLTRILQAWQAVRQFQNETEQGQRNTFAAGGRPAQQLLQSTLRQATAHRMPGEAWEHVDQTGALNFVTEGMTDAQKADIRHRYFLNNPTVGQASAAMQADLATVTRQLAQIVPAHVAPPTSASGSLSASQIAALARQAGFSEDRVPLAVAIALAESSGQVTQRTSNHNRSGTVTSVDRGLFQINDKYHAEVSDADTMDPLKNAQAAFRISQGGANWNQWTTFRTGAYKNYLTQARAAAGQGFLGSAITAVPDEKAADDLERKRIEALRDQVAVAEAQLKIDQETLTASDPRTMGAAQNVDMLKGMLAKLEKDRATLLLNKSGVGTTVDANQGLIDKAQKEALKVHKDATEFHAETAQTKYGILSPISELRAQQAQQAAVAAAKNDGDLVETWALLAGTKGPLHDFLEARKEELRKLYTSEGVVQTSLFPIPQAAIDAFRGRPDVKAGEATAAQKKEQARAEEQARQEFANRQLEEVQQNTDDRLRAIDRQAQSGGRFGDPNARERAGAQQAIDALMVSIDELTGMYDKALTEGLPTEQVQQALHDMSQRVLDTTDRLHGLNDALAEKELQRQIKAQDEGFDLRSAEITRLHGLRFNKDEEKAFADEMQKLRDLLTNDQERLRAVLDRPLTDQSADQVREAQKRLKEDYDRLADYPVEYGNRKAAETYNQVKTELTGSLMNFFHGQGDITQVFKGLGSQIVDSALEAQIKRFSDPLIQTTTKQILEIQGNTEALKALDRTMSGGCVSGASAGGYGGGGTDGVTGFGAVVAAGVAAGMSSTLQDFGWGPVETQSGTSKKPSVAGTSRESDLQKGIGAGLAAYSIGSTSASQGVNAGNFLGGVVSGASIGSTFGPGGTLIGGIVGGAIDLIGGLFHHASKPTETPQDLNPAYYNAPSGFDVAAYNYSAYGKLPTMQDVGFTVNPAKTPIVNVYVDGAKVAAKQVVSQQGSSAAVNLVNTTMARHAPV